VGKLIFPPSSSSNCACDSPAHSFPIFFFRQHSLNCKLKKGNKPFNNSNHRILVHLCNNSTENGLNVTSGAVQPVKLYCCVITAGLYINLCIIRLKLRYDLNIPVNFFPYLSLNIMNYLMRFFNTHMIY